MNGVFLNQAQIKCSGPDFNIFKEAARHEVGREICFYNDWNVRICPANRVQYIAGAGSMTIAMRGNIISHFFHDKLTPTASAIIITSVTPTFRKMTARRARTAPVATCSA